MKRDMALPQQEYSKVQYATESDIDILEKDIWQKLANNNCDATQCSFLL